MPSERDCIRFIMLCRGKRANPYEGDCFLIGYDSKDGPSFSLVCGVELFLKRASAEVTYDGNESGVILLGHGGNVSERAGLLVLEGEKLVGGWARVFRKDHKQPEYKAVKLETYDTGRSRWLHDKPGMIAKVALSQALRAAFPIPLGGLYTQEEMQKVTETGQNLIASTTPQKPVPRLFQETAKIVEQAEAEAREAEAPPTPPAEKTPAKSTKPEAGTPEDGESLRQDTVQMIRDALMEAHVSEGRYVTHLRKSGVIKEFSGLDKLTIEQAQAISEKLNRTLDEIKEAKKMNKVRCSHEKSCCAKFCSHILLHTKTDTCESPCSSRLQARCKPCKKEVKKSD